MIGRSLSHFLIVDKIGEGGMGVVYRARDTHLERDVAVKVLPAGMLAEDNARRRFRNEALALSKLNHPNIESVYEFGNEEGVDFLVMEHLEGETLAARLGKGPLPLGFIVRTGGEILAGLEAAHREGLVHRDLKPGNIMLTRSGAKLLDFGLAKDLQERPGAAGLTAAPTATSPLTAGGAIVGTFQYMAPEQLEGKPADPRSDLFAFGAVLYEMASGRKAFEGKSQASLIAAILKEEPRPISSLQPASPPALDRLVRACLAKDPAERIQSARDARIALEWIADAAPSEATPTPVERGRGRREAIAWGVSLVLALAAGGLALRPSSRPETNERLVRFTVQPPKGPQASQGPGGTGAIEMTLSPDGKHLILGSPDDRGRDMLWVRSLDRLDARPLAGTEEARYPFWSPDGTQVGFFVDGFLKKVSFPGGAAQVVCRAPTGRGGAWNRDGVILFSADKYGPLFRVSAEGGEPAAVTEDRSKDGVSHRWPQFLPDQDHFIYVVSARSAEASGLFVGSLGSKESKPILAGLSDEISNSMFVPPGYLVFGRNHTLMAQPFDAAALRLTGGPVTLTDAPIGVNLARNFAAFSVSGNGVLAFQPDEVAPSRLVWLDRSGRQVGAFASAAYYSSPRISPDGQRVALIRHETHDEAGDLWVYDLARDGITRMTFDPGTFGAAAWLPGGRRIGPADPVQTGQCPDPAGSLDPAARRGALGAAAPADEIQRGLRAFLTRRALARICIDRIGPTGGVCASLPGDRSGAVAGLDFGRNRAALATRRPRVLLPGAGFHLDVGESDARIDLRVRGAAADLPLPAQHPGRRHGLRRVPGRQPLPRLHDAGEHPAPDDHRGP